MCEFVTISAFYSCPGSLFFHKVFDNPPKDKKNNKVAYSQDDF